MGFRLMLGGEGGGLLTGREDGIFSVRAIGILGRG